MALGYGVTQREYDVLMAVAEHDDVASAAAALGLSENVVRATTMRLRRKLEVKTNLQALVRLTAGVRFVATKTITTDVRLEPIDG